MRDYILSDSEAIKSLIGELDRLRNENASLKIENVTLKRTIAVMQEHDDTINRDKTARAIEMGKD